MKQASPKAFIQISEKCFAVSSYFFLFILKFIFNGSDSQQVISYSVGILFCGFLLLGIISLIRLDFKRRKDKLIRSYCPEMLRFFRNKKAKICVSCMIVSILVFMATEKHLGLYHTLSLVLLALSVLSIYLHSILNGNNYAYVFQKGV